MGLSSPDRVPILLPAIDVSPLSPCDDELPPWILEGASFDANMISLESCNTVTTTLYVHRYVHHIVHWKKFVFHGLVNVLNWKPPRWLCNFLVVIKGLIKFTFTFLNQIIYVKKIYKCFVGFGHKIDAQRPKNYDVFVIFYPLTPNATEVLIRSITIIQCMLMYQLLTPCIQYSTVKMFYSILVL